MFELAFSKLLILAVVALIVLGPERLPRAARTLGALLGKAQRYVNEVKREVNQTLELDELRKMKSSIEGAAREFEDNVRSHSRDLQVGFDRLSRDFRQGGSTTTFSDIEELQGLEDASKREFVTSVTPVAPVSPRRNWRSRRSALPSWYKAHQGVRKHVQSGAARVARHSGTGRVRNH